MIEIEVKSIEKDNPAKVLVKDASGNVLLTVVYYSGGELTPEETSRLKESADRLDEVSKEQEDAVNQEAPRTESPEPAPPAMPDPPKENDNAPAAMGTRWTAAELAIIRPYIDAVSVPYAELRSRLAGRTKSMISAKVHRMRDASGQRRAKSKDRVARSDAVIDVADALDPARSTEESPQGDAVLNDGSGVLSFQPAADLPLPQTDANGEDSAVTTPERAAASPPTPDTERRVPRVWQDPKIKEVAAPPPKRERLTDEERQERRAAQLRAIAHEYDRTPIRSWSAGSIPEPTEEEKMRGR